MRIHAHTQTHTNTHRHTQTHTDTHIHTQTHTDTHIHTYTHHHAIISHTHTILHCVIQVIHVALYYNKGNFFKSECNHTYTSRVSSSLSLYYLDTSLCDITELSREAAPFKRFSVSSLCMSVWSILCWRSFVCTCFATNHDSFVLDCRCNNRGVCAFFIHYLFVLTVQGIGDTTTKLTTWVRDYKDKHNLISDSAFCTHLSFCEKGNSQVFNIKLKTYISFHSSPSFCLHLNNNN